MKKFLGIAVLAAATLAVAPAQAQRSHTGASHGGTTAGTGFHGRSGPGYRGGYGGGRGGYRGGYGGGFYGGLGLGFGYPGYYAPYYYGQPYAPAYYGYGGDPYAPPYAPAYAPSYGDGYGEEMDDVAPPPRQSRWQVSRTPQETDYELPESVLFGLDSSRISPNADTVLAEIADAAMANPQARIVVEGHTDTSGTREHNQELSDARAKAVAAVLARHGVSRARIRPEGIGESQLAVQTADGVREPRNRRVVVRVMNGAGMGRDSRNEDSGDVMERPDSR